MSIEGYLRRYLKAQEARKRKKTAKWGKALALALAAELDIDGAERPQEGAVLVPIGLPGCEQYHLVRVACVNYQPHLMSVERLWTLDELRRAWMYGRDDVVKESTP